VTSRPKRRGGPPGRGAGRLLCAGIVGALAVIAPLRGALAAGGGGGEPAAGDAPGLRIVWAAHEVRQGDVVVLEVRAATPLASLVAHVGRWAVEFWPEGGDRTAFRGLVGVDLEDPPGPAPALVEAWTAAGERLQTRAAIRVRPADFPVQHLKVPRPFVELDAPTLARVQRERDRMEGALAEVTPDRLWAGPFQAPLAAAPPPHGFGSRRVINGEARAPHTGADYAAPAGTPVLAAQGGRVALAEEHFFSGRAVVIDHGLRLFTMYFHLEAIRVREGDLMRAGQVLGTVGASGRATGPHLHWGARLGGARIDPAALLRALQGSRER
jgi:peptidase M23-like protein